MAYSGLAPDPPTPPNPMQTAAAQTGTNVSTAIANSYLGNVNQQTPQGNLNYNVTGNYNYTDPTTGQSFNIPRWTAEQTLTPQGQEALSNQQGAQVNLAQLSNQQSGALKNLLGTSFNPQLGNLDINAYLSRYPDLWPAARQAQAQWGQLPADFAAQHWQQFGQAEGRMPGTTAAPQMGDMSMFDAAGNPVSSFAQQPATQYGYGSGGDVTRDYDPGWDITRSYGPQDNFSADRARVEEGMFQRLNPQLAVEEDRINQRLADQGIRPGSPAYKAAYDVYARQANDARLGVIERGGAEQQRLSEMARQQATFENMAQAQGYSQEQARAMFKNTAQEQAERQAAARGAFFNSAQAQEFQQAAARGTFFNQAQQQALNRANTMFGAQNSLRNQWLAEQYQQRTQPINEITALLSGSQVQQPSWVNAQRTQIPTTDVAGLINQGFAQQNDIYKTGLSSWNDLMGGLLGAGGSLGSAAIRSDRNVKENIVPMGKVFSNKGALPIYQYSYKDDPEDRRHVGPMAQDVEKIEPSAVRKIGGVKHIDLNRMGAVFGRAA